MGLFVLFQLTYAFILNFTFAGNKAIGIFLGLFLLLIIISLAIIFWKSPKYFG